MSIEPKYRLHIKQPSFDLSDLAEMPLSVSPQIKVDALFNSNKRETSSGAQPSSPIAKQQKN